VFSEVEIQKPVLLFKVRAIPPPNPLVRPQARETKSRMDDRQQQRINSAAQQFTDALVAAYRTASDNTVVAQQLGARQIEYFFDTVIDNLRTQAEGASQVTRQLAGQQRLAREVTRDLTQASTDNYMDLLDSVFAFYQGGTSRTRRRAEEAQRRIEEAEARAEQAHARAEEAERIRSEAERQTQEAKRSAGEAQRRVKEAEKSARAAQRRAEEAESSAEEAQRRVEEAEARAEERAEQADRRAEEADRRTLEAERRAAEAGSSSSEAESQGGDTQPDAVGHPLSTWLRTLLHHRR
jgi:chromosome segregation ATPase